MYTYLTYKYKVRLDIGLLKNYLWATYELVFFNSRFRVLMLNTVFFDCLDCIAFRLEFKVFFTVLTLV